MNLATRTAAALALSLVFGTSGCGKESPEPKQPEAAAPALFSVEGWTGSKIRIRAEYDVARIPEYVASELRRLQTLRVMTEGRF